MSFREVQTLEHFCRLLFEVTLHESYFGWAASMQFSPEVKGPPISLVWRNAYSVSVPIHRPACLSGLAPGQGLRLGSGGEGGRLPKIRDLENEGRLLWVAEQPRASQSWGVLLLQDSMALICHSAPQSCPRTLGQLKPQRPGLLRGKVSSRVGTCCAWWWQWHWQWWGDNVAASSCVGGDSGVRREVEFWGALLTDVLD